LLHSRVSSCLAWILTRARDLQTFFACEAEAGFQKREIWRRQLARTILHAFRLSSSMLHASKQDQMVPIDSLANDNERRCTQWEIPRKEGGQNENVDEYQAFHSRACNASSARLHLILKMFKSFNIGWTQNCPYSCTTNFVALTPAFDLFSASSMQSRPLPTIVGGGRQSNFPASNANVT
jgi:hypothetical protein